MDLLNIRAGELYQQLGPVTALAEDWSSGSRVHLGWLAPSCNFSSGDLRVTPRPHGTHMHVCRHLYTEIKNKYFYRSNRARENLYIILSFEVYERLSYAMLHYLYLIKNIVLMGELNNV